MKITVISPVYQAGNIIDELVTRMLSAVTRVSNNYEIILVEDGSNDNSWQKIEDQCARNQNVIGVKLSRNFGQHYAITAGISKATGDEIIIMDCDLQDDPLLIENLLKERAKGFDIVFTKRKDRKHGLIKTFNAWIYNRLFEFFSEKKYDVNAGSLVLISAQVAKAFLQLKDKDRLYLQMFKWVGFKSTIIEVLHQPRFEGKSTYSFIKLLKIGLQGWTSHSSKLLWYSIYLGFTLSLCSLFAAVYVLINYIFYNFLPGWPSIIISILGSTGLILLSIGVTGIYIGKIFEQVKDRPLFIIEKELNVNEK